MKRYFLYNYRKGQYFFLNNVLQKHFVLADTYQDAHIVFFGPFDNIPFFYRDKIYIFIASEHFYPNVWQADFAIIYGKKSQKNIFHSLEMMAGFLFIDVHNKLSKVGLDKQHFIQYPKTRFCNFMYGNQYTKFRNAFFLALNQRKKVDSLGSVMKNMDMYDIPDMPKDLHKYQDQGLDLRAMEKLYTLRHYKFTIAMENGLRPYSFSEKVIQALEVGSVPIYWGPSDIDTFVNKDAYIDARDFDTIADLVAYVLQVDTDVHLYQKYRNANPYVSDVSDKVARNRMRLQQFIENDIAPYTPKQRPLVRTLCRTPVVHKILRFGYHKFWKTVMSKRKRFGGW